MPFYLVERTLPYDHDPSLPGLAAALKDHQATSHTHFLHVGVTWIHSYVTLDNRRSFCLYEGPNPEAVRQAAGWSGLPIDRINEVRPQEP